MMNLSVSDNNHAFQRIPQVPVDRISGFLEELVDESGHQSFANLATNLLLTMDELLPIVEAAALLDFVEVNVGEVTATPAGRVFADATIFRRRLLFREQVLENVPFIAFIARSLRRCFNHEQTGGFFWEKLQTSLPNQNLADQMQTAIEWGRYAELFEYDAGTNRFRLLPIRA